MHKQKNRMLRPVKSFYKSLFAWSFCLIVVLILTIAFCIFYVNFQYNIEVLVDSSLQNLDYAEKGMDNLLQDVKLITDDMYINRTIDSILTDGGDASRNQSRMQRMYYAYKFSDPLFTCQLDLFDFFGNKYTFYNSAALAHAHLASPQVESYPWYDVVREAGGRIVWMDGAKVSPTADELVFAARIVKNAKLNKSIGVAVVSFFKRRLVDGFQGHNVATAIINLADASGDAILWPTYLGGEELTPVFNPALIDGERGYYISFADDELVVYQLDSLTRWYIVQKIPLPSFFSFLTRLAPPVLALLILALAAAGGYSYYNYRKVSDPILLLVECMRSPKMLEFALPELDVMRNDEIGHLNRGFMRLIDELRDLFARLLEEQEAKRHAEMHALQAQINPHFLYNTLTAVRYLIQMGQKDDANQMLISLIKLLKINLDVNRPIITVFEELECLENFFLILSLRYDNFDVVYQIQPECLNCAIPKLLIQPLAENSLFHGLKDRSVHGQIGIGISLKDGMLCVEVWDTGQGFDKPFDPQAEGVNAERGGVSIGLKNVNDRLVLRYGQAAALRVESAPGKGARVTFSLPAICGPS